MTEARTLHNVVVFCLGDTRLALDLRWVREIVPLPHLTPVPGAPAVVAGVAALGGEVVPVLATGRLLAAGTPRAPRPGDTMIVFAVDDVRAALAVDRIDEVSTLETAPEGAAMLVGARGGEVQLLDPPALVATALGLVRAANDAGAEDRDV